MFFSRVIIECEALSWTFFSVRSGMHSLGIDGMKPILSYKSLSSEMFI
jgi:hypothetical protein